MNYSKYKYIYRHPYFDRYFSQIMRHLLSFFVSKLMNIKHVHTPFNAPKYPKGHEDEDINLFFSKLFHTEMLLDIENIDNKFLHTLSKEEIFSSPDQNLVKPYDINDIFSPDHIELLRSAYKLTKHCRNYDPNIFNVCIHIRRGDVVHEFAGRYSPLSFFIRTIELIKSKLRVKYQIHVYSD